MTRTWSSKLIVPVFAGLFLLAGCASEGASEPSPTVAASAPAGFTAGNTVSVEVDGVKIDVDSDWVVSHGENGDHGYMLYGPQDDNLLVTVTSFEGGDDYYAWNADVVTKIFGDGSPRTVLSEHVVEQPSGVKGKQWVYKDAQGLVHVLSTLEVNDDTGVILLGTTVDHIEKLEDVAAAVKISTPKK